MCVCVCVGGGGVEEKKPALGLWAQQRCRCESLPSPLVSPETGIIQTPL